VLRRLRRQLPTTQPNADQQSSGIMQHAAISIMQHAAISIMQHQQSAISIR
jgi:hypothetical protein